MTLVGAIAEKEKVWREGYTDEQIPEAISASHAEI